MEHKPNLSVVIPLFQRRAPLERILRALPEQTPMPGQSEIIAVMDGSPVSVQLAEEGL